ncbi:MULTISPECIES: DedA family protein [Methylomonas]|uniref:DedA family protein n=1 Tax=Methylomonas TaxID=416 RepID=UPI001232BAEA|nr:DedA family protein [Methylomonas rhizoryzae]
MDLLQFIFDILIHIDRHLANIISEYGNLTYAILFIVIFIETGLVVMPFLPGDSLLFAAGAFVSISSLELGWLIGLLSLAAIAGDTLNYAIGRSLGRKAYDIGWIDRKHLDQAQAFYDTYGGKTIVLARFVPVIRTFAPFVAGIGRMSYGYFIVYNIIGGAAWVSICSIAGYWFGNIPVVKQNFELAILAIVLVSILPIILEIIKSRRESASESG